MSDLVTALRVLAQKWKADARRRFFAAYEDQDVDAIVSAAASQQLDCAEELLDILERRTL